MLNLGSGDFNAPPPWWNIDSNLPRKPTVVASIGYLPFPDASAERIYAGHVLEHIGILDVVSVLKEIRRVLHPDGTLMIVGPDVQRAVPHLLDGRMSKQDYDDMLLSDGHHEISDDGHRWPCVASVCEQLAHAAGFTTREIPILEVDPIWPVVSRVDFQFAFEAKAA